MGEFWLFTITGVNTAIAVLYFSQKLYTHLRRRSSPRSVKLSGDA